MIFFEFKIVFEFEDIIGLKPHFSTAFVTLNKLPKP